MNGAMRRWVRRSRVAGSSLDGANVASLALMGVVT